MSRAYEFDIEISKHDPEREDQIQSILAEEIGTPIDDWEDGYPWEIREPDEHRTMWCSYQRNLCGGESEEEFVDRLSEAVWKANGGPCRIEVRATYLEDLPYETHVRDGS